VSRWSAAKALLEDENTCASIVYMSALAVFGADLQEFEYETLRLECQRQGIEVAPQNWEELFAALALRGDGRFMFDAAAFENTIVAFNGATADARNLQPAVPAHIAWGVKEADIVVADLVEDPIDDYFDYEPIGYAAVLCKAHGMVCVPPCLEFCAERLEELTKDCDDLRQDVKKAWAEQGDVPAAQLVFTEDAIGVQLALMHAVQTYVQEREATHKQQLRRLL
jgi:hypothetical protein